MTPPLCPSMEEQEALVVFTGRAVLKWLHLLKPGFRHCFLFLKVDIYWIQCNPMAHQTALTLHDEREIDWMMDRLLGADCTIVRTVTRQAPLRLAPWRPYTCVEAVKRGLCIQEKGIWTPWQLYRFLIKNL